MNRKTNYAYLIIIIFFIVSVAAKQNTIRYKRSREILSTVSCWQKTGKPVVLEKIKRKDIRLFTKVTMKPFLDGSYRAFVPKTMQAKIKEGQSVFPDGSGSPPVGEIRSVAEEMNINYGMFEIEAVFSKPVSLVNGTVIVYINTGMMRDIICVDNDILSYEEDGCFIWTVDSGRAHRKKILTGQRDGYGTVVIEGLAQGDTVVIKGSTMLSENDKVNIKEIRG